MTKTKLTELFNGSKTWEQMSEDFSLEAGITITPKMVQQLFKENGFNLRSRSRKSNTNWFTIIDDTPQSSHLHDVSWQSPVEESEKEVVDTEEFA